MAQRDDRNEHQSAEVGGELSSDEHQAGVTAKVIARKPYRKPLVQKRRSLHHATLFTGSGTPGVFGAGGG